MVALTAVLVLCAVGSAAALANSPAGQRPAHVRAAVPIAAAKVAAGNVDSYVIRSDGTLWSWGGNRYGELGHDGTTPCQVPVQVGSDSDWAAVASGLSGYGRLALKQNGSLWQWGANEPYYLGLGGAPLLTPTQVGTDSDWAAIAQGADDSMAIKQDGTLWAWGPNYDGELGLGDTNPRTTPTQVGSDSDWAAVACGFYFTVAIKQDGSLWAWGRNDDGELGLGNTVQKDVPNEVDGTQVWSTIACGSSHTLAVTASGALWAWGYNAQGQLGLNDQVDRHAPAQVGSGNDWLTVAAGDQHSAATKTDHSLWAWGYNGYGELGIVGDLPSDVNAFVHPAPVQIGSETDWAAVACGSGFTLGVRQDDSFVAWGDNTYGQIGVGYPLARCVPTQVGSVGGWTGVSVNQNYGLGIRDDGSLWGWGTGPLAQTQSGPFEAPVPVGSATDWSSVAAGNGYAAALKTDGSLWTWGSNDDGELGLGDADPRDTPTQVGGDTDWTVVSCGGGLLDAGNHTLALKSDGSLWAWGNNEYGELGMGNASLGTDQAVPAQVAPGTQWQAVFAGDHCSYAIKDDGSLWAWGHNADGQLGLSDKVDRAVPTQVGSATDWKQLACGADADLGYALAVKSEGTLWSWGNDETWALGLPNGQVSDHLVPTQVGSASDWDAVAVGGSIAAGHGLAVKYDGTLWSWGMNLGGQLGQGFYRSTFEPMQVGSQTNWGALSASDNSFALRKDGTLWSWGYDQNGQLAQGDPLWHPEPVALVLTTVPDGTAPTVSASPTPARAVRAAAPGWYRTPVKIKFSASDGGWGVSRTQYTLNGGISWWTASSLTVKANGTTTVTYDAVDRAGNVAATQALTVHVDKVKPVPAALNTVKAKHGKMGTFKCRVTDKWSPTCAVTITVKRGTKTVAHFALGQHQSGVAFSQRLRCKWAKGTYRWEVYATDLAGNVQLRPASAVLIVK